MNARIAEKTRANTVLHHIIICPPNKGGKTSINISINTGSMNVRMYDNPLFSVA
ncbi:TPA: hypothetical protein KSJ59_004296 [Clostridioides difficile]|nr:hypothetical protein [Clostridioides difficile]